MRNEEEHRVVFSPIEHHFLSHNRNIAGGRGFGNRRGTLMSLISRECCPAALCNTLLSIQVIGSIAAGRQLIDDAEINTVNQLCLSVEQIMVHL